MANGKHRWDYHPSIKLVNNDVLRVVLIHLRFMSVNKFHSMQDQIDK